MAIELTGLSALTTTFTTAIFWTEKQRIRARQIILIRENVIRRGKPSNGFFHGGVPITEMEPNSPIKGTFDNLDYSLTNDADALFRDMQFLEMDLVIVRQGLTTLLRECKSHQDIRDALPEIVVDLAPELKQLPRTREEAYTIRANPDAYRRYLKIRDKISFYNAVKLMY